MPDSTRSSRRATGPTTPNDFPASPIVATLSGLDHSFLLQMMMDLKGSVSALKESVDGLKDQSRDNLRKIEDASKNSDVRFDEMHKQIHAIALDVHAAKASGKTLLWVMGIIGTLIGIFLGAYLTAYLSNKPSANPVPKGISALRNP